MSITATTTVKITGAANDHGDWHIRAADWRCLGETLGYARHAGKYRHYGRPKTVSVYALHARAGAWSRHTIPNPDCSSSIMHNIRLTDLEMEQLHRPLQTFPEPRGGWRQLHRLATVLESSGPVGKQLDTAAAVDQG